MYHETVDVFVPNAGAGGSHECTVVERAVEPGGEVTTGEVLARLRSGHVDLGVQAPLSGTVVTLHARDGARMRVGDLLAEIAPGSAGHAASRPTDPRSSSSAKLVAHAPLGAAIAISAAALAWPVAMLLASVLAGILVAALRDAQPRGRMSSSADVVVAPLVMLRGVGRVCAGKLTSPAAILRGVARTACWLALAVLVPAVLGAVAWLVTESADGLLAAARLAAYGYALPIFAVLASFWILRHALESDVLAPPLRGMAGRLPDVALSAAVVAGVAWIVACVALFPDSDWAPASSMQSVVQALPAGLRDGVNDVRASIAAAQARGVVRCVTRNGRAGWRQPRAFVASDGTLLVGVRPSRRSPPGRRSFAVLVLALQNELSPSRVNVAVVPSPAADAVSFETLETNKPVADVGRIFEQGAGGAAAGMPAQPRGADLEVALKCSAAAV